MNIQTPIALASYDRTLRATFGPRGAFHAKSLLNRLVDAELAMLGRAMPKGDIHIGPPVRGDGCWEKTITAEIPR